MFIFDIKYRTYTALAVKNIEVNFIFLARLCLSLRSHTEIGQNKIKQI